MISPTAKITKDTITPDLKKRIKENGSSDESVGKEKGCLQNQVIASVKLVGFRKIRQ